MIMFSLSSLAKLAPLLKMFSLLVSSISFRFQGDCQEERRTFQEDQAYYALEISQSGRKKLVHLCLESA